MFGPGQRFGELSAAAFAAGRGGVRTLGRLLKRARCPAPRLLTRQGEDWWQAEVVLPKQAVAMNFVFNYFEHYVSGQPVCRIAPYCAVP